MQGSPRRDEGLRGLDTYEQMVNTFACSAKAYWRLWGTLGEPMVRGIDSWAETQRAYLQWLRQTYGRGEVVGPNPSWAPALLAPYPNMRRHLPTAASSPTAPGGVSLPEGNLAFQR